MNIIILFAAVVATFAASVSGSPNPVPSPDATFGFTLPNIPVGNFDPSKRVTGGSDASAGEFPFMVSMQITPMSGAKYHNCGGVIVDPTHIVTAGHCVVGKDLRSMEIVAGAHNVKDANEATQQRVQVKRLVYHPNYNGATISHDSAIITLASPLTYNARVAPLRLAPLNHEPTGSCVTFGWGNSNPTGGQPAIVPDALQKVTLDIVDRDTCRSLYNGINYVDQTMICARDANSSANKGSCNGDSGGPMLCTDYDSRIYMAGIVSWTVLPCGQARFPTVFGNVANMRPFIDPEVERP